MSIYFDNSATTRIDDKALEKYIDISKNLYSNPSSMHRFGYLAEMEIKDANDKVSSIIGANTKEIIWTSGGTESNNLAIKGAAYTYRRSGMHLITTSIEHSSVKNVFKELETCGYKVTYLPVDNTGHISIKELINEMKEDTILVSIMYVNNEIGSTQDISNIGRAIKEKNSKVVFHTDFVQGFGKYNVNVKKDKIDLLSVSSHKFHGPKGVGFLYKNSNIRIKPQIIGGGQQNAMRSGTLNVPGIVSTKIASEIAYDNLDEYVKKVSEIRDYTIRKLIELNNIYNIIYINTRNDDTFAPHIVSVSFKGIRAEVMLHALEEKEIYVSSGSACSSHDKKTSNTLIAIGLQDNLAESTIRLSFSKNNRKEEVDNFIIALNELIPKLLR